MYAGLRSEGVSIWTPLIVPAELTEPAEVCELVNGASVEVLDNALDKRLFLGVSFEGAEAG